MDSQRRNRRTRFPEVWFYNAVKNLFVQPEPKTVDESIAEIYRRAKSLGQVTFSLGDVLASARHAYGTPWLSALYIPRRSIDIYAFFAARDDGLTCSFYALSTGGDGDKRMYFGEPVLYVGESIYRGVTEKTWDAFSENRISTKSSMFGGELSTVETTL